MKERDRLLIEYHDTGMDYNEIAKRMSAQGYYASNQTWRKRYSRLKRPSVAVSVSVDPMKILKIVKGTPKRLVDLADALKTMPDHVASMIAELANRGHEIDTDGTVVWMNTGLVQKDEEKREEWNGNQKIRILLISDTHLCSRWQQLKHLNAAYDDAIEKECDFAVHCGDITDGFYQNRPGHIYELFKRGYDEQLDYLVESYPRRKKKDGTEFITKVISGNHDHTHLKADGANIVKAFARQRTDIEFLGDAYCKLWLTPKCDMDIQHPQDGSQYAISYSTQKLIDAMQGGSKPKIYAVGHHHKAVYYSYRNIHTFEVPCLQAQTPFEWGAKISVSVGWWIVSVEVAQDGTVKRVSPELVQCYEMASEDY